EFLAHRSVPSLLACLLIHRLTMAFCNATAEQTVQANGLSHSALSCIAFRRTMADNSANSRSSSLISRAACSSAAMALWAAMALSSDDSLAGPEYPHSRQSTCQSAPA